MSLFISYNWGQEDLAEKMEASIRTVCPVLRDTNSIVPWGSIEEFMNRIRKADFAVLLISDEYLKSINCMYEACQLYKDDDWRARRMYVVLENAEKNVYAVENHGQYIQYWKEKKEYLEEQKKHLPGESIDSITAEIKRVSEILVSIGALLKDIRDTNNPTTKDEHATIEAIKKFVVNKSAVGTGTSTRRPQSTSGLLQKSLADVGFDGVFTEVTHGERLSLINPYQLRLFQLGVVDNAFTFETLKKFLLKNIGFYIYSRERIKKFMGEEEFTLIGLKAVELLRNHCNGDLTWLGDELGDLMLYVFLEQILDAPKVFSKFELPSDGQLVSGCSGVHLLHPNKAIPSYQMVFGKSNIIGNPRDAIDTAFITLEAIKNDSSREMRLVESTAFDKHFLPEIAEQLKNLILPVKGQTSTHDTAFGVFLGYSLGIEADGKTSEQFRAELASKIESDIRSHAAYIADKIKAAKMEQYSFYFYFLPFNRADEEKKSVMASLLGLKE